MRIGLGLALIGLLAAAGCRDSSGDAESFALLRDDSWSLQEAIDPPRDDAAPAERPPSEWYAEYVRDVSDTQDQMVRLSGHAASIDEAQDAYEEIGWRFDDVSIDGWDGLGGTSDDPAGPAVVLLDHGPVTFILQSYELTVDELASVAGLVEVVDHSSWEASDGFSE